MTGDQVRPPGSRVRVNTLRVRPDVVWSSPDFPDPITWRETSVFKKRGEMSILSLPSIYKIASWIVLKTSSTRSNGNLRSVRREVVLVLSIMNCPSVRFSLRGSEERTLPFSPLATFVTLPLSLNLGFCLQVHDCRRLGSPLSNTRKVYFF